MQNRQTARTHSLSTLAKHLRLATITLTGAAMLALSVGSPTTPSAVAAPTEVRCDFDGDGQSELAIGSPGDRDGQGAVHVVDFGPFGTTETTILRHGQNVSNAASSGDRFGSALACGDFNGDGFADLAAGSPGTDNNSGIVNILYGSEDGLADPGGFLGLFHQNNANIDEQYEEGDFFGQTLAAGDFNDDGVDDLAIGVPGEDRPGSDQAALYPDQVDQGLVHVLYGRPIIEGSDIEPGISAFDSQTFRPNLPSVAIWGPANYGFALTTGDFDNDGVDDLAIGAPKASLVYGGPNQIVHSAGAVHLIYGSPGPAHAAGLDINKDHIITEQGLGPDVWPSANAEFGRALAAGNFDGKRGDELAVGTPGDRLSPPGKEISHGDGSVQVLSFGTQAQGGTGHQYWTEHLVGDGIAPDDYFGFSLTTGDFDGSGQDDLVIGAPNEILSDGLNPQAAGAVTVIFGGPGGLTATDARFYSVVNGIPFGTPLLGQQLGYAVGTGDFQGDGRDDLVIGIPGLSIEHNGETVERAGAVAVIKGTLRFGLTQSAQVFLHQGLLELDPMADGPEETAFDNGGFGVEAYWDTVGERFGHAVAN